MASIISRMLIASRPVRVALSILLLLLILVGAAVLNVWSGLEQFVAFPSRIMRILWLPLLVLLVVIILGVVRAIWRLAADESRVSKFPDIDWAWDEAMLGLRKAAIGLDRAPLILVLGEPANGIEALFEATTMSFLVWDLPRRPNAPLSVYATRDAIFVACPESSVLARLAGEMRSHPNLRHSVEDNGEPAAPAISSATTPAALPALNGRRTSAVRTQLSPAATATAVADQPGDPAESAPALRPGVLSRTEDVEIIEQRLRHLCGLIVRDRRPFCPVNGILTLIPYAATADDGLARQTGTACHRDVSTARTALGVSCPLFTLVCDMEEARYFDQLIRAYAAEPKYSMLGRSFPLVPDIDIPDRVQMILDGMEWIRQSLISPMIYRLFQLESATGETKPPGCNVESIHFLCETHERWHRLGRILGRLISLDPAGDLMLGGCYLAATGPTDNQRGFVAGVVRTILEHQNFVAWTTPSLRSDQSETRRATLCNLGFCALWAVALTAAYLFWSGYL